MTLQQLKYADAVASCGSLSEAARRVFVTQPTLTEAIRTLEEELRIAIFSRTTRGVTVTREGEEFLASARQILADAAAIQAKYTGKAVRLPLKNLLYCFVREPALFQHSRFFSVYHCIISARRIQAFIGFVQRSPIHGDLYRLRSALAYTWRF